MRTIRDKSKDNGNPALWADVEDKAKRYYVPILQSFLDELNRLASANPEVPGRLINYLLGRYDFYKIITDDKHKTTRVEAINICGSLGQNSGNAKPLVNIEKLNCLQDFIMQDLRGIQIIQSKWFVMKAGQFQ